MSFNKIIKLNHALALTGLAFFVPESFAQDKDGLSGRASLGILATSGNSDSQSANANFDLWWNYSAWNHHLNGDSIKSTSEDTDTGEDVDTAEAYGLAWQSKYSFSEADYIFGKISWDKDEFSAYDRQLREVIGYGRRLLNSESHYLAGEIGVGARQSVLIDDTEQDEAIGYLGAEYRWTISQSSKFTQLLSIESGSNNTYVETTSSLSSKIRENLAVVLSYKIKNNSDVLPDVEKTDTVTTISLEYGF